MDSVNMAQENYHHGDLRSALVNGGLKLLDNEGPAALGIRRLARELGVAHSAPANHFPNKKALWTAVAVKCFETLLSELDANDAKTPQALIENMGDITIQYGLRYPHRFRLMFRWHELDQNEANLAALLEQAYQYLLKAIAELAPSPKMSTETYAISFWSMVHGYTLMRIEGTLVAGRDDKLDLSRDKAIVRLWMECICSGGNG